MNLRLLFFSKNFLMSSFLVTILFFSGLNASAASSVTPATTTEKVSSHKLSKFQKWALEKITKKIQKRQAKIEKLMKEGKVKKARQLSSNMRLAVILAAVGLILLILGVVSYVFAVLGAICLVVGLVLLLLEVVE
jgi:Flp pilus assembly protein TadB